MEVYFIIEKNVQVHRLMYHNFIGDVPIYTPTDKRINHKCSHENNGKCINPWHMYLGTAKDNMQDAINDGTKNKIASGEKNPMVTVSDKLVLEALKYKDSKLTQLEIAEKIGVNQSQISRWFRGENRTKNL